MRMGTAFRCGFLYAAAGLLAAPRVEAFSFSVEPSRIEVSVPAGKQRGKSVRVQNKSEKPVHLKTYVLDVVFLPDGTSDFPEPGSTPWSCATWLRVVPEELDLPPGGMQDVRVSLAAPADSRGGYYAMIFFETGPSYVESGLGINFRIGAFTQATIPNTEVYQAKLADLAVESSAEVRVGLFNEGNVLFRPKGKLKIVDASQKRVRQVDFNPQRVGVLPNTLRIFRTRLEPLPPGSYRVKAELDYGTKYLLVGERAFDVK